MRSLHNTFKYSVNQFRLNMWIKIMDKVQNKTECTCNILGYPNGLIIFHYLQTVFIAIYFAGSNKTQLFFPCKNARYFCAIFIKFGILAQMSTKVFNIWLHTNLPSGSCADACEETDRRTNNFCHFGCKDRFYGDVIFPATTNIPNSWCKTPNIFATF
jgi:hypothetical protein